MKPVVIALVFLSSCSMLPRAQYAIVYPEDIPKISGMETVSEIQDATKYQMMDFGRAMVFSALAGIGQGFYESRVFYGGRAFPNESGPEWDWYRQDRSGDEWLKIGASDKIARTLWASSLWHARMDWSRFFGGSWVLSWLADFIVCNSVATIIRSYGKYGEFRFDFDISLPRF